jgi:hypothetical protein
MNTNESRDRRGRLALEAAIRAFDQKMYNAAHTWAEVAAETIKACNLTPAEQRDLVAPRDDTPLGERVFFVSVILVLLLAVGDVLRGFLQ